MAMAVCLIVGLLLWSSFGASSPLIVQTNKDLLLEFKDDGYLRSNEIFVWKNSHGHIIVRAFADRVTINEDYKDRVEFWPQNRSLILKNVHVSDSGTYTAVLSRKTEEALATFDVSVVAPVSAVNLSLDSVSKRSDSCNFTVSCRTELFSVRRSFTCDSHNCTATRPQHSGHAHSDSFSLHLYLSDLSIICNHSNHVSWTQDTEDVQQMCVASQTGPDRESDHESVLSVCFLKTVVYTVGLLLMLSAVVTVHVLERRSKQD